MSALVERTWTVYQLRNTLDGTLYFGQTVQTLNDRWTRHCALAKSGHTSRLAAAIRQHGADCFEGLALIQCATQADADTWEQTYIGSYPASALYNDQTGGRYAAGFSPDAEEKRRAGIRGVKRPDAAARLKAVWAERPAADRAQHAQRMVEGKRAKACARKAVQ